METFKLKDNEEYILLNNLLQVMSYVGSGGEAKVRIQNEEVVVNEEIETRVRKKLRSGDIIKLGSESCKISSCFFINIIFMS